MPKGNAKSSSSKPKKCDGRTPGKEHFSSVMSELKIKGNQDNLRRAESVCESASRKHSQISRSATFTQGSGYDFPSSCASTKSDYTNVNDLVGSMCTVMDEMIKKQIVTPSPSSKFDHSGDQSLTTPSSNRKYSSTSSDETPTRGSRSTPKKPRRKNSSRGSSSRGTPDGNSPKFIREVDVELHNEVFMNSEFKPEIIDETESINSEDRQRKIDENEAFLKQCEMKNNEDKVFVKTLERKKQRVESTSDDLPTSSDRRSPYLRRKMDDKYTVNLQKLPVSSSSEERTEDRTTENEPPCSRNDHMEKCKPWPIQGSSENRVKRTETYDSGPPIDIPINPTKKESKSKENCIPTFEPTSSDDESSFDPESKIGSTLFGNKAYYPNHKDEEKSPLMAIKDAEEEYGKSEDEIVDVEIFDDFGWYDNRPVSFWFENLLYLSYGLTAFLNWLNIILCLLNGIFGIIASYSTFVTQMSIAAIGLLHLLFLPLLTEATSVTDYLRFLRHSKSSIMTRRLVHNWTSKWRIYLLNLVLPWNMLFFQKNFNYQRRLLEKQANCSKVSSLVKKECKSKLYNLKKMQTIVFFRESAFRDPFQLFIAYNLFIQLTSNPTNELNITSQDLHSTLLKKVHVYICCAALIFNMCYVYLTFTVWLTAWFECSFKKALTYGSRLLYLGIITSQLIVSLMFINQEGGYMLKDFNNSLTAGLLVCKIFGLFIVNLIIFLLVGICTKHKSKRLYLNNDDSDTTILQMIGIAIKRTVSSILFWCPNFTRKLFFQNPSELFSFLLYTIVRQTYIGVLWKISHDVSDISLEQIHDLDTIMIVVFAFCTVIPLLFGILLFYVLTDPDYCKKIALYLTVVAIISGMLSFIFLLLPQSNRVWDNLFD